MARYGPIPMPVDARFWRHVPIRGDGCWEWSGARRRGYGVFALTAKDLRIASRFAWELTYGPITDGRNVLHACDNCGCVNPDHLFLGTQSQNLADAYAKGRLPMFQRNRGRDEEG